MEQRIYTSELKGVIDSTGSHHILMTDKEKGLQYSLSDICSKPFWDFNGKNVELKITIDIKEISEKTL